jgi:hypothetical protein
MRHPLAVQEFGKTKIYIPAQSDLPVLSKEASGQCLARHSCTHADVDALVRPLAFLLSPLRILSPSRQRQRRRAPRPRRRCRPSRSSSKVREEAESTTCTCEHPCISTRLHDTCALSLSRMHMHTPSFSLMHACMHTYIHRAGRLADDVN